MPRRPFKREQPEARGNAKPAAKVKRGTDQRIHDALYAAIIDHRVPPGSPLQEDALATAFGVSRTIVRKVLQQLAYERLVLLVPNKGASVAKPSTEEAREVFEARRAIERILIERVIAAASDADIAGLTRIAKAEELAQQRGSKQHRLKLSGDFHRQLADVGGNSILAGLLNELVSRTSLIIALFESPGAVPCSHSEHLEIADAIRRRDTVKAVQYMDHHLKHIEAQLDLSNVFTPVDFRSLFRPAG